MAVPAERRACALIADTYQRVGANSAAAADTRQRRRHCALRRGRQSPPVSCDAAGLVNASHDARRNAHRDTHRDALRDARHDAHPQTRFPDPACAVAAWPYARISAGGHVCAGATHGGVGLSAPVRARPRLLGRTCAAWHALRVVSRVAPLRPRSPVPQPAPAARTRSPHPQPSPCPVAVPCLRRGTLRRLHPTPSCGQPWQHRAQPHAPRPAPALSPRLPSVVHTHATRQRPPATAVGSYKARTYAAGSASHHLRESKHADATLSPRPTLTDVRTKTPKRPSRGQRASARRSTPLPTPTGRTASPLLPPRPHPQQRNRPCAVSHVPCPADSKPSELRVTQHTQH